MRVYCPPVISAFTEAALSTFKRWWGPTKAELRQKNRRLNAKRIRQIRDAENLAETDHLTNLTNRRGLDNKLPEAIAEAIRHGTNLSIIAIDLDGFKRINDQADHNVGNSVLVKFSGVLKRELRFEDIKARVGGDEFVAVLKDVRDVVTTKSLAEYLRVAIQDGAKVEHEGTIWGVTGSIGVVHFDPKNIPAGFEPTDFASMAKFLSHQADLAAIEAKRAGKNRVHFATYETQPTLPEARLVSGNAKRLGEPKV